jgi:hypothetical protein
MWDKIRNKASILKRRKRDILLLSLWTVLIALIVIKSYWISYNTANRLIYEKPAYPGYDLSRAEPLDLLVLAMAGAIVVIFLSDFSGVIWGFFASVISAFIIGVIYVVVYMWFFLDLGSLFSALAYGWEWAVFISTSIVFALMFPWIFCVCLLSFVIGSFLRALVE